MRVRCVGAIVHDAEGRLLIIRRGRPPGKDLWSLPGGRVEPGETDAQAVVRELAEETGLRVEPGRLIGSVERPGPDGVTYDIHDYAATVTGGQLTPGDDAADARWTTPAQLRHLPTTDGLLEALTGWRVLRG
jgi:8-oxo-dGTP diphosphatase